MYMASRVYEPAAACSLKCNFSVLTFYTLLWPVPQGQVVYKRGEKVGQETSSFVRAPLNTSVRIKYGKLSDPIHSKCLLRLHRHAHGVHAAAMFAPLLILRVKSLRIKALPPPPLLPTNESQHQLFAHPLGVDSRRHLQE